MLDIYTNGKEGISGEGMGGTVGKKMAMTDRQSQRHN